ncbi:MAG: NtaA/DmoA family FMN-dependent monooxygenase, partial [Curtobacterium sp.]
RGRVGFNLVTAHNDRTAQNYGLDAHYDHDERYRMASEWAELVTRLLTSWEPDAVLDDVSGGRWADFTKIHGVDHQGEYFSAKGPLNLPPGPQGVPVFCQAGGSPVGRDFAAGVADTIVAPSGSVEQMRAFRSDVRERAAAQGRDPEDLRVLFLTDFTIGDSDADARALLERKHAAAAANIEKQLARMSFASGIDFSQFDLDAPVPAIETNAARTSTSSWFADKQGKTLREIASNTPPGLEIVGSPATAADQMEAVMDAVGGDGFLVGNEITPRAVADVAGDLVPELRRRGLVRSEYSEPTLRGNLRAF